MSDFLEELRATNPNARTPVWLKRFQERAREANAHGDTKMYIHADKYSDELHEWLVKAGFKVTHHAECKEKYMLEHYEISWSEQ